jgi:hypothetical protein
VRGAESETSGRSHVGIAGAGKHVLVQKKSEFNRLRDKWTMPG